MTASLERHHSNARIRLGAALLLLAVPLRPAAFPGPFDGKRFQGRIAYSADGNFNDPDDWAASPIALAILGACGVQDRLVHFDYNGILPKTDLEWERKHAAGVLGAAKRYGFSPAVFHDCQRDLEGAIRSIRDAVNASSAEDPLFYILAGPMEVPYRGIAQSDPTKRRFVYCISHNCWNDGYASGDLVKHNKRDVIPTGVHWVQITDQNRRLSTARYGRPARPEEFRAYFWMRDSRDPRVRFLWERMLVSTRPDPSDSGMAWFLMTGAETPTPEDYRRLLDEGRLPPVNDPRSSIRLEAENFPTLDGFEVEYRKDRSASQRVNLRLRGRRGRIETRFREPYSAPVGEYNLTVRLAAERAQELRWRLLVNDRPCGEEWTSDPAVKGWSSHVITAVRIAENDAIAVVTEADRATTARLDYLQLDLVNATTATAATVESPCN